jgi:probable LLM family oxidoreductase
MTTPLEFGLDTFGDVTRDAEGHPLPHAQVLRNVVEEAVLADRLGVDFIGLGEHHRADFAISSPEMVLAAIAGRTSRIHLGSAVTVLGSDDPVRVFQRFSTLNAVSNGRAEVILGRGSFTESFPLFGFDLEQYEELFEERLALYALILEKDKAGEPVTWSGNTRAPLKSQRIYPMTERGELRTWVGVGGSPASVVRAARYGFPLILAIIGGDPRRFRPYVELFHRALGEFGKPPLPIGIHSPGYVADTDEEAQAEYWPGYRELMSTIGRERGWPPVTREQFDHEVRSGSLYVGSAETVARKIAATMEALGATRFQMKYSSGPLAHEKLMGSIERYATRVIPRVRELLGAQAEVTAGEPAAEG